ncbi:hypothetical protein M9980_14065 [Sphingomonas donggukensis]|uniref:Haemolysin activator HlyB C-terminal domain-containing protein n=1 Tax=Sphingomonas donggukensis TaxID=2949093 RepID=A0ABY4TUU0_9SPHN|nr:hypothetical protein [Sphingomonas donggukensis]URW75625.1 hypothetical protein M9980_14065 [Sphingomonas donggukensis]
MTGGRPLRFLGGVAGGWIGLRVLLIWHETGSLPQALREAIPIATAAPSSGSPAALVAVPLPATPGARALPSAPEVRPAGVPTDAVRVELALLSLVSYGPVRYGATSQEASTPPAPDRGIPPVPFAPPPPARAAGSRLSGSAWVIARGGSGLGAGSGGSQLGGSQAGIRADYALGHGLALTGRLATPFSGIGREAAVGVAWRPAGLPVRVVVEQRIALDAGRGGPAVGISGGVSEVKLPSGFRLEGYGQAGVVFRTRSDPYADGAVRGTHPLVTIAGVDIDAGGGAWGGAQRGAARLDVGPTLGARLPVAGRTLRLALDWRERVAGDARPGSGPALSIGTDF